MDWGFHEPVAGDMVRVKLGSIYHYGVYVGDDEVIQFGLAPQARTTIKDSEVEVCTSNVAAFLHGGFLEVVKLDKEEQKKRIPAQKTVELARSRLGEKGYSILYNNCEHFAYECVLGEKRCTQAEIVRNYIRSLPVVNVFVAKVPDEIHLEEIYPQERATEIASCGNERVQREKYGAWQLLEYALHRTFGQKIHTLQLTKNENGKWTTPTCFFSISHSDGAVAVVVSRTEVGLDIEKMDEARIPVLQKVLTKQENAEYATLSNEEKTEYLFKAWTGKECVFKTLNKKVFQPAKIEVAEHSVAYKNIQFAGERYALSVATEHKSSIRWFMDVQI